MLSLLANFIPGGLPAKLIAIAVAVVALYGAGFYSGRRVESWRWGASETAAVQKALDQYKAEAAKGAAASTDLAKKEDQIRGQTRTIAKFVDRIVEKPVYRNVCLDVDGLRAANEALTRKAPTGGQPDGAVPRAGASDGRPGSDSAPQAR